MKKKQILGSCLVLFAVFMVIRQVQSFFDARFQRIERAQEDMLSKLQQIHELAQNQNQVEAPLTSVQEIGRLKNEILRIGERLDAQSDVLGYMESASASAESHAVDESAYRFITIADARWRTVDVFLDKRSSSQIIGQAVYGQSYPYARKESGYYNITLTPGVTGWIHSQFVKEY